MGKRIGYIFKGRAMPKLAAQRKAVIDAGVDEADIWQDDESRKTRIDWILTGRAVEDGDTIVVALIAAIAKASERRTILRKIEKLGVTVEDLKADVVKVKRPGRPPAVQWPELETALICEKWWDRRIPPGEVVAFAKDKLGDAVNVGQIKRRCGPKRSKPKAK